MALDKIICLSIPIICSRETQHSPWDDGWMATFLLTWHLFSGHVSFLGRMQLTRSKSITTKLARRPRKIFHLPMNWFSVALFAVSLGLAPNYILVIEPLQKPMSSFLRLKTSWLSRSTSKSFANYCLMKPRSDYGNVQTDLAVVREGTSPNRSNRILVVSSTHPMWSCNYWKTSFSQGSSIYRWEVKCRGAGSFEFFLAAYEAGVELRNSEFEYTGEKSGNSISRFGNTCIVYKFSRLLCYSFSDKLMIMLFIQGLNSLWTASRVCRQWR